MNEADRFAREMAEREHAGRLQAEDARRCTEVARRVEAVAEIEALIPWILARLEATNYWNYSFQPIEVDVFESRRLGRPRRRRRGGWMICAVTSLHYGEVAQFPVYLLSTGRLCHYGEAKTPRQIIVKDHDTKRNEDLHVRDLFEIRDGLRAFAGMLNR